MQPHTSLSREGGNHNNNAVFEQCKQMIKEQKSHGYSLASLAAMINNTPNVDRPHPVDPSASPVLSNNILANSNPTTQQPLSNPTHTGSNLFAPNTNGNPLPPASQSLLHAPPNTSGLSSATTPLTPNLGAVPNQSPPKAGKMTSSNNPFVDLTSRLPTSAEINALPSDHFVAPVFKQADVFKFHQPTRQLNNAAPAGLDHSTLINDYLHALLNNNNTSNCQPAYKTPKSSLYGGTNLSFPRPGNHQHRHHNNNAPSPHSSPSIHPQPTNILAGNFHSRGGGGLDMDIRTLPYSSLSSSPLIKSARLSGHHVTATGVADLPFKLNSDGFDHPSRFQQQQPFGMYPSNKNGHPQGQPNFDTGAHHQHPQPIFPGKRKLDQLSNNTPNTQESVHATKKYITNNNNTNVKQDSLQDVTNSPKVRISKYRGVTWSNSHNAWEASVLINAKRTHIGYFDKEADAARAWETHALRDDHAKNCNVDGPDDRPRKRSNTNDLESKPLNSLVPNRAAPRTTDPSDNSSVANKLQTRQAKTKAARTSKFRGVIWDKNSKAWRAKLSVNGKLEHIGLFDIEEEAAKAWDLRAVQVRGVRARLNFPEFVVQVKAMGGLHSVRFESQRIRGTRYGHTTHASAGNLALQHPQHRLHSPLDNNLQHAAAQFQNAGFGNHQPTPTSLAGTQLLGNSTLAGAVPLSSPYSIHNGLLDQLYK